MSRILVVTFGRRGFARVIGIASSLAGAADAIKRECERRELVPIGVDGMDISAFVDLKPIKPQDEGGVCSVTWWAVDGGPEEVVVDELHELSRLLGGRLR